MTSPVYLFSLASQHAHWASVRQAVVAGNIANANTPSATSRDVQSFSSVMNETALRMASTSPAHFEASKSANAQTWEVHDTGRSIALDREMIKAGEVNRAYTLDTTVMRSFHRMVMSSLRSGA